jgi:DNA mismatch endonuclease (patch repair protein)
MMSRVGQKNTLPELLVRSAAHKFGLRFRLHRKDLPGSPDLVFPKFKLVVFVHGCFWHRHVSCKLSGLPKSNVEFWREKFQKNVERDSRNYQHLRELGWGVEIIWQCEVPNSHSAEDRINEIFGQ